MEARAIAYLRVAEASGGRPRKFEICGCAQKRETQLPLKITVKREKRKIGGLSVINSVLREDHGFRLKNG